MRGDVDQVDGDTTASWDLLLDLSDGCSHLGVGEVTTTSKFDLVTSVHGSGDEIDRDSAGGHTSDHDWRKTEHATHLGVNEGLAS